MPYRSSISVYTDGACDNTGSGNVGRAIGLGIVLQVGSEYRILEAVHGEPGTSNVAEWLALYRGLAHVAALANTPEFREPGATIVMRLDSQLVVNQMNRVWLVNDPTLANYFRGCVEMESMIAKLGHHISFVWIPREQNDIADQLSKIGRRTLDVKRPSWERFNTLDDVRTRLESLYRYATASDD